MNEFLDGVQKKLEAMAEPFPRRDGFHLGMRTSNNAIELEYGQMLMGAVRQKMPDSVVEFGTGPGYSSSWILLGLEHNQKGHLFTCDVAQPQPPVWEQVGCPAHRLAYVNSLTAEVLAQLPAKIDIFFHDASHNFDEIKRDIEMVWERIPKSGIILVHDVNYSRKMGDALAAWFDSMNDDWKYQEVSMGCGMGIAERLSEPKILTGATKRGRKNKGSL